VEQSLRGLSLKTKECIQKIMVAPDLQPKVIRMELLRKDSKLKLSTKQISNYLGKVRKDAKDAYWSNTTGGLITFTQEHQRTGTLGPDEFFVLTSSSQVVDQDDRYRVTFSTLNLLKNAIKSDIVCMDGTYRIFWNDFPLLPCWYGRCSPILPIGYCLSSNEDEISFVGS